MPKLTWNPPIVPERTATYHWAEPHAAIVHEHPITPRRWTDHAIAELQPAERLAEHYQQTGSVVSAFEAMAHDLNQGFRDAIESPIWDWPRATIRSDGSVVTSPRDILDTGALRDSQSFTLS